MSESSATILDSRMSDSPQESSPTQLHGPTLWLARLAWVAILILVFAMLAANLPHLITDTRLEWQVGEAMRAAYTLFPTGLAFARYVALLRVIAALVFASTALLIAWRKSDDWMALFTSAALLLMIFLFGFTLNIDVIRYPPLLQKTFPAIGAAVPTLITASLFGLFFLFPNGRVYRRWLVWPALLALALAAGFFIEANSPSYQFDVPGLESWPAEWNWPLFGFSILGAAALGLISRIFYYHRAANAVQKQQMKWVLWGMALLVTLPIFSSLFDEGLNLLPYTWRHFISLHLGILLPLILPLTIGVSVLHLRLWDVDRVINRTVVYGALTAILLILYGLTVGLAGALLPDATSSIIPFLALILIAVLVMPLRQRLQALIDRWLPASNSALSGDVEESPAPRRPRLLAAARLLWSLIFLALAIRMIGRMADWEALTFAWASQWLVGESVRALPGWTRLDLARWLAILNLSILLVFWSTAVFIFWRKKRDWLALYVAYVLLLTPWTSLTSGGGETGWEELLTMVSMVSFPLLFFFFPDGRFVPRSRRWRLAIVAMLPLTMLLGYLALRLLQPAAAAGEAAYGAFLIAYTALILSALLSQIVRYRHISTPVQRQQTKWVLFGTAFPLLWMLWAVTWVLGLWAALGIPDAITALVTMFLSLFSTIALPITIAFSIFRYRLWDVDLVINRALVVGALTALIVGLYVLLVGLLGALFQTGGNLLLTIVATGLIAVLFHPVRQRLQRGVNRMMYGHRDDPLAVLSELGNQLERTAVPGQTLPVLVTNIAETLKLPYVAIELAQNDGKRQTLAEAGRRPSYQDQPASLIALPMIYQGQTAGVLLVAPRTDGEGFSGAEEGLLRNIAQQAAAAVYAEQLTNQLQRSRKQLIAAREEERRRLRRDLHDDLGPQLATMAVKLSAAENLLHEDPSAVEHLLAEVRAESQAAIREVRRVVDGLRPPALDQLGLISAIEEFVAKQKDNRTVVALQAPHSLPDLPAAVEVAAYRIVTEAVINTLRHAQARNCMITLTFNGLLSLSIQDDGHGLPPDYRAGVGLVSMRERASELGGRFAIQSTAHSGTTITASLPLVVA